MLVLAQIQVESETNEVSTGRSFLELAFPAQK